MQANTIQWLKETIAPRSRNEMPDELKNTYDFAKKFSQGFTDYTLIENTPKAMQNVENFRRVYEGLEDRKTAPMKTPEPKPVKAEKPKPEPKPAKPKPEPQVKAEKAKKEKDCNCDEKKKADVKTESVKKASVKTAKPKADKKPAASDKAVEKAREELRKVKAENREYEKKIMFDSDFLTALLKQTQKHAQMQKGLGALPTELSQELKKERALNTLYRDVMKRNVKAFKFLEVRLKKSNEVTPAMERKFMQLYSTLNGLKQSAVAKRKVTVKKKKKGFLARLFS